MAKDPKPEQPIAPPPEASQLPAEPRRLVKILSRLWHTHNGIAHPEGDIYEVEEAAADNLGAQGKAVRVE